MRRSSRLAYIWGRLFLTLPLAIVSFNIVIAEEAPLPPAQNDGPTQDTPNVRALRKREEKRTNSERKKEEARVKQAQKADKKPDVPAPKSSPPPASSTPSPPPPDAPSAPQPTAPQTASEPIGEFEPVVHARDAKITTCMDKIVRLSARVIDRPHSAASTYVAAAPNDHSFQSIIGMRYPNKAAPNGTAVIVATPINGSRCEGETVQIYPTTNSCTAVQAELTNSGRTLMTLQSLPLMQTKDGNRELLMPTAGGGCVVISVGLN